MPKKPNSLSLPSPKEDIEQINLFRWAQMMSCTYPALEMMFHIPNGGKRSKTEAARFKNSGGNSRLLVTEMKARFYYVYLCE